MNFRVKELNDNPDDNPANIYLFIVYNRNTRKRCEICLKLPIKNTRTTSMTLFWCFIVNFELISHIFQKFLLLSLNQQMLEDK